LGTSVVHEGWHPEWTVAVEVKRKLDVAAHIIPLGGI
jgi:hypothetical protein